MIHFPFDEEIILENEVALLRPLQLSDVNHLLEIANEEELWKYSFLKGNGQRNLTNYIQSTLDKRNLRKDYPFIVYDKRAKAYAGSTRFCEITPFLSITRLGFTWYGKKFQGTGLNKNCKYLLFEYAFEKIGFERIGMAAYIENKRSIAAMQSVGCQIEGKSRGIFPALEGKGRTDAVLLSILKDDWLNGGRERLRRKINPR